MWFLVFSFFTFSGTDTDLATFKKVSFGVQEVYEAILDKDGRVDYVELHERKDLQEKLTAYQSFIAKLDPTSIADDKLRISIYANAYNVLTLIGVNRAYPVTSVRKIRRFFGFFTKAEWTVGGESFSLNDIEKKLLRPLDSRIHFIINCASASCPKLPMTVMTASNVETLMDNAAREFILDESKNSFESSGVWELSKIFDWYADDWGGKKSMIEFILKYHANLKKPQKIEYLEYDWTLNDQKQSMHNANDAKNKKFN